MAVNSVVDRSIERSPSPGLRRGLNDQRDRLTDRLEAILLSPSEQKAIAARSYWHPNGFAKLVLAEHAIEGQLRLHLWPEAYPDDDIHGHSWLYESVVLIGGLTEIVYAESDAPGDGWPMWRHTYNRVAHRRFAFTDPVAVRLVEHERRAYAAGDESGGHPKRVHRFFASQAPAATLLRIGPVDDPISHVYRRTAEPPHLVTPRPTTRNDVRTLIDMLVQERRRSLPAAAAILVPG